MDVLKLFVEEPAALRGTDANTLPASLDALLARSEPAYGRAYLAGTHLSNGPPRVGVTALANSRSFVDPLLTWSGGRLWQHLDRSGGLALLADAAGALAQPEATAALVLGPVDTAALIEVANGDRADALRALLSAGASVLVPEPAHDGWDWSVFGPAPLGLVDAVRAHPAPPGVRRFVVPYQRARGEHSFYFEQWALDPPPAWADPL